jgi:tetratricopeptide (TPR) repeat protein
MNAWVRGALLIGAIALVGATGACGGPDVATQHRERGDTHLANSEWQKAVEEYEKSIAADPKQEKTWEKIAWAHMQAGEMDKADAALLKTLDLKPDPSKKAEVYRNLAGMYMQKANSEKAEKYFLEAVNIDPKDDTSLGWLGEMYSQKGGARDMKAPAVPDHLNKAIEFYDKMIAAKPELPTAYLNKRIAVNKLLDNERQQKASADMEAQNAAGDKAKEAEAKARSEKHQARMDELKTQFDDLTKKLVEVQKNAPPPAPPAKK